MSVIAKLLSKIKCNKRDAILLHLPVITLIFNAILIIYLIHYTKTLTITENLSLTTVSFILNIFLILEKFWPQKLNYVKLIYWHIPLCYATTFFTCYMLLRNNFTLAWQITNITAALILIFFTNWITALLLAIIGSITAITIILSLGYSISFIAIAKHLIIYSSIFIFCAWFSQRKTNLYLQYEQLKVNEEKLSTLNNIAAIVAHELRTPLSSISMCANNAKEICINSNQEWRQQLPELITDIQTELQSAQLFINMLLINADQSKIIMPEKSLHSIAECITETIQRYPFKDTEKQYIHCKINQDFQFFGNKLLIMHTLFNLLKNALQHIKNPKTFQIKIYLELTANKNMLHFQDTGTGISSKVLPFIFDRFYSKNKYGTGIGLTFCKQVMQEHGGNISCNTKIDEYTNFTLSFPIPEDQNTPVWHKLINKDLNVLSSYPSI